MNKFLIAAFAFTIIVAVGAEGPDESRRAEFTKYMQECKAEIGASDDDIKSMTQESNSEKSWCVIGCVHKKSGFMGADNKINMNKLQEDNIPSPIISLMQECKTQTESVPANLATQCTAAKALGECIKNKHN